MFVNFSMYRILIAILLLIYSCEEPGCTDPDACNYAPEATEDAGNCEYVKEGFCDCYENIKDIFYACGGGGPDSAYDVTGNCIFDWDNDGICDVFEETDNISDIDGNNYQTVQIGSQLWMKENLQVAHYRNGDEIPLVINNNEWSNLTSGAYCDYENSYTHSEKYGKLYNGYTALDNRGICMDGWHVPFDSDWGVLSDYLGESSSSSMKMISTTTDWHNTFGDDYNNQSNFTALPSGIRYSTGEFTGAGYQTAFISSLSLTELYVFPLSEPFIYLPPTSFNVGYSIRCIKNKNVSFIDIDGNHYETIQFGNQLWFTDNLKTSHYNNGDIISTGYTHEEWIELENGAYSVYPIGDDYAAQTTCGENCANVYGNLYNWYAVEDSRGICPLGSHVPTEIEWMELEMFLGMSEEQANMTNQLRGANEGSKLAGNTFLWQDFDDPNFPELGNCGGNIDGLCPLESDLEFGISGFNALPSGWKITSGNYFLGYGASFWSSTESDYDTHAAWHRAIQWNYKEIIRNHSYKLNGNSIRCLAD